MGNHNIRVMYFSESYYNIGLQTKPILTGSIVFSSTTVTVVGTSYTRYNIETQNNIILLTNIETPMLLELIVY